MIAHSIGTTDNSLTETGSTGKKVIVCGDSAGGNLSAGLVAQCVQLSLPKPDHLALFYPSLLCQMYPSPSRILSFLDPIVSFPCLLRCLNAYTDQHYKESCPRTFDQGFYYVLSIDGLPVNAAF